MREILFRGKDIKGNWYEGLLAHNIAKDEWYISNKAGISTAYQVRPETIGQYTGLIDSNGRKIFEGDVIQDGNFEYNKYVVEYSTERGGFLPFAHGDGCGCCETVTLYDSTCHTVIGNIYDNPELIGGNKNG